MSNLPIYDHLMKEIENEEEITLKQQDEFMKYVKNFDKNGYELIYALIRIYQLENSDDKNSVILPYGGKYVKNEMKFDFNELPINLKKILYKFSLIHIKTMQENIIVQNDRENIP